MSCSVQIRIGAEMGWAELEDLGCEALRRKEDGTIYFARLRFAHPSIGAAAGDEIAVVLRGHNSPESLKTPGQS